MELISWNQLETNRNSKELYGITHVGDKKIVLFILRSYVVGIKFYKAYLICAQDETSLEAGEHRLHPETAKEDAVNLVQQFVEKSQNRSKEF